MTLQTSAQSRLDRQPLHIQGIAPREREQLIVSTVAIGGIWHVLSRYGDDIWQLNGGPTNASSSSRRLNFKIVPPAFRDTMKAIMYRYIRHGRRGWPPPSTLSLRRQLKDSVPFLRYLQARGLGSLSAASPPVCAAYATECKSLVSARGAPLRASYLAHRFSAVEAIFELSQYTNDRLPTHPWQETTATLMAGVTRGRAFRSDARAQTPLIPDEVFCKLFQAAWSIVERGDALLDMRDQLEIATGLRGSGYQARCAAQHRQLRTANWACSLRSFGAQVTALQTACYIVVASLSGCRNHELAYLQSKACYKTENDDGEVFWWMRSRSTKTGEGLTEWMVPEAAVEALRLMDRWAIPHQRLVQQEIDFRRSHDLADPEIAEAQKHVGAVFLGRGRRYPDCVRTLTLIGWRQRLQGFARDQGIEWEFNTHQFRRKFANYAARSQFGDLRYLKQHFKHWSFDMTLGYAMNESQEMALYSEIYDELADLKDGLVADWLKPDVPLAGRLGRRFVDWRGSGAVTIFKNHASMVNSIAEGISIRSNGHAWCTADAGIECIGNGSFDRTRCSDCENAVIGRVHATVYQGLYDHLCTLVDCKDIGDGGIARVRRDIARCADVLRTLGHDPQPVR